MPVLLRYPATVRIRRLLLLTQYFEPEVGAPQVRLASFVSELTKRGIEVEVVTALPNHPEGRIQPAYRRRAAVTERRHGAVVRRVWMLAASGAGLRRMLSYLSFTATSVLGIVRCRRPDVIVVESPPPFLFLPARMAGLLWRRPVLFNVADLWPDSALKLGLLRDGPVVRLLLWFESWVYRRSSGVIAVTEGLRQVLTGEKGVPPEKVSFLPNGVDTELFAPRPPDEATGRRYAPGGERVIVYAGTVGFAHGVEVAVDAMALVAPRHPDAKLLIVGAGSGLAAVEARIARHPEANVELVPPVQPDEVARLYNVAVAGLSTLRDSELFEGTRPSKVFPVMASGKPVLYSGAGEGARLVEEHGVGIVCPPEDAPALAEAICRVLEDDVAARDMGERGRKLAMSEFSWEALIDSWLTQLGWEPPAS